MTLAAYAYDNLNRLQSKSLHGSTTNKQTYAYNVRSWLTGISGTKFTQNLYYNTGVGTAKYNGSISSMTWKSGNESTVRGYKFTYNGLDRMQNATYGETAGISTNANRFSENVTGYDKNGNIKNLQRYGQTSASGYGLIDNLTCTLTGNQLNRVDDAVTASAYNGGFEFKDGVKQANEYVYDANGNLTKDLNKGITGISYNCLNLPSTVAFSDGSTITYTYAADGTKLRTVHKIGGVTTTTDYCGNVVYENGVQKLLLTEEGYVTLDDNKYHYYLKDHQGNNRVVINQSGAVEETNHYYPFGGVFAGSNSVQPYKYNGKEFDAKKGLNWYDYGARHYDAALGRFHTNDRFAEKYYSMSPYQYGANNPVGNIDVNGDSIVTTLTTEIDGKMTNIDYTYRTDTNGEYGFFDAQGSRYSGDDSFMNSLTSALSNLRKDKVGNALVDELMNSSNIVNIANRKTNSADSNGTYITWNSSCIDGGIDENGNRTRPAFIALGHEMAHIQDVWKGTYDGSLWVGKVPNAEKYATHIENQLRSEHGLPLRTHYGVLDTGRGDPRTPLLRKGAGVSLYYKRVVGIGGVYVPTTPYIY
jgi:RHS repeat-associated protein